MQQEEIEKSLALLEGRWDVDPLVRDFVLRRITDVEDRAVVAGRVVFHIPYLRESKKYVLWKCLWPDCHNCCERQGRLPLTMDDLITIGSGMKYARTSEFVGSETVTATWGGGGEPVMTTVNLKRKEGETEKDDGTRIPCRFLGEDGACGLHPHRPGVCYLYPFSAWLAMEGDAARVHASYQFTGDCPGFYAGGGISEMAAELDGYSGTIYEYAMKSSRTSREGFGASSLGA